MSKIQEILKEIKVILYKSKSPKMDNSHQINAKELDRKLNKLYHECNELEKQNEKVKEYFVKALDHLDYCGWGDSWERECSRELEKEIDVVRKKYKF